MKKFHLLIFSLSLGFLTGCGPTISSELFVNNIKTYRDIGIRFPKRVLVLSDGNYEPITNRATKIFTQGLEKMGFELVNPKPIYDEFNMTDLNLSWYTGVVGSEDIKKKSEEIRKSLADKFRIEGAFILHAHGDYIRKPAGWFTRGEKGSSPQSPEEMGGRTRWFTEVSVFLYQVPMGYTLWKCSTVEGQLFESRWEDSIETTTKKVIRYLERDIEKVK